MNKLWIVVLTAALVVPAMAHEGHDHGAESKPGGKTAAAAKTSAAKTDAAKTASAKTDAVSGELVDMACYMNHEGKGEKHTKCAEMCVKGGSPLGMVTSEGQVYLLVNDHDKEKAFAEAKLLAGSNAKVTGKIVNRGGVQAIVVDKAEKL
jgi:hypothetical protein